MLRCVPRYPHRVTATELRGRLRDRGFDVTSRTVERDLRALSEEFPLVADVRNKPYGWSWAKGAAMEFAPGFTPAQAVALLLARTHLHPLLPKPMHNELAPLFEVAEGVLKETGWKDWHARTAVLPSSVRLMAPKVDSAVLASVHGALGRRRCLEGQYRAKGTRKAKPMVIHPLGLLARGAVQYLVCTLFDYGDVRQLAVHRLAGLRELEIDCQEPANFCFRSYVNGAGATYETRGLARLVARFQRDAAEHLTETPLTAGQTWRLLEDGRVEVSAEVQCDQTLRWWLLGFGARVEVIEPAELRASLAAELSVAAAAYAPVGARAAVRAIAQPAQLDVKPA